MSRPCDRLGDLLARAVAGADRPAVPQREAVLALLRGRSWPDPTGRDGASVNFSPHAAEAWEAYESRGLLPPPRDGGRAFGVNYDWPYLVLRQDDARVALCHHDDSEDDGRSLSREVVARGLADFEAPPGVGDLFLRPDPRWGLWRSALAAAPHFGVGAALAADAAGVAAAEDLADEALLRARPWFNPHQGPGPVRPVWRGGGAPLPTGGVFARARRALDAVEACGNGYWSLAVDVWVDERTPGRRDERTWLRDLARPAALWEEAAARGYWFGPTRTRPGRPIEAAGNPFVPLLEVVARGYRAAYDTLGPWLFLSAPPLRLGGAS